MKISRLFFCCGDFSNTLDLSFILLERKSKADGLCSKEQTVITLEETRLIADKDMESLSRSEKPFVKELCCKMQTEGLRRRMGSVSCG